MSVSNPSGTETSTMTRSTCAAPAHSKPSRPVDTSSDVHPIWPSVAEMSRRTWRSLLTTSATGQLIIALPTTMTTTFGANEAATNTLGNFTREHDATPG